MKKPTKRSFFLGLLALAFVGSGNAAFFGAGQDAVALAPPTLDEPTGKTGSETVVFAGGCFWGVQGVFQHVKGVKRAVSGYAGGSANTAEYERVSDGDTGHAESVRVTFDTAHVSYGT